jgi:cysteine synthase B
MIVDKITDLIGNTPMVKIAPEVHGLNNVNLYAKMEMMNPFGSVKDRIAWEMLKDNLDDIVSNNKLIVENSSGNTSKAMQAIAGIYGANFKLMSAIAKVPEPLDVMRILGADIEELTQAGSDCFDPNDPNDPQYLIEKFIQQSERPVFFTSQFTNEKNIEAHRKTTAPEIMNDLDRVDWFVGGLGTTGSSRGIIETIQKRDKFMKSIGVCGATGELIPGIRAEEQLVEAGFYERKIYDEMICLNAPTAVDAMLELNHKSGILCGPSSGAQYAAIKQYFNENPATEETNIVLIACDRIEWYISYIKKYRPDIFGLDENKSVMTYFVDQDMANKCHIMPANLQTWIDQQQPIIIDMRTPASLKVFGFKGAINIPEKTLEDLIEKQQPFPKNKKVLFICAVGQKSLKIAAYLRDKKVDAYSLEGGIVQYQKENSMLRKKVA